MDREIIYILLIPFFFALVALPLIIRFIIGKLVFRRIRKRHIEKLRGDFPEGGKESRAFDLFEDFLKGKINSPFVSSSVVRDDFRTALLIAQNAFNDSPGEDLKFSFSLSELIKCFFLLMNDLEELWKGDKRIEKLSGTRVSTFLRINRITNYYSLIYKKIPFLRIFRKGRVTGKIMRILLVPLIGLPSIFISIVASLISLFFTEIIWRHYYSVFLAKSFYYILILYGGRNSLIGKRLQSFSWDRIRSEAVKVEKAIDPENDMYRSALFEEAYLKYQQQLELLGVSPEKDLDFNGIAYRFNRKKDMIKRILQIPIRTAGQYNPLAEKGEPEREQLMQMIRAIATPYNRKDVFYSNLRIIDLFDSLYMISLLAYSRIQFSSFLLDSVSLDFLISTKNISDELTGELLFRRFPFFRKSYRTFKLYRKSRFLYKALRRGNAVGLILSVSGPLAVESMRTAIRDYLYRRAGRMTLYCYEANQLNKKRLFEIETVKESQLSGDP